MITHSEKITVVVENLTVIVLVNLNGLCVKRRAREKEKRYA